MLSTIASNIHGEDTINSNPVYRSKGNRVVEIHQSSIDKNVCSLYFYSSKKSEPDSPIPKTVSKKNIKAVIEYFLNGAD